MRIVVLAAVGVWIVGASPAVDTGEEEYVVVKAGRVITVSGEEFSPGIVVIVDGKISAVGGSIEYPPEAEVIDAPRETVMPGFVLPRTRFGLGSYKRNGVHGDQNVASEVYLQQMLFDDLLEAGYTTACYVPSGTGIPGLACAFRTGGPDESRRLSDSTYLNVSARFDAAQKGKSVLRNAFKKAKAEIEKVEKARTEWEEKQKKKAEEEAAKKKEGEKKEGENGDNGGEDKPEPPKQRFDEPEKGENGEENGEGKKEDKPAEEEKFEPPPIDPKHQPLVDLIQEKEGALMMIMLSRASDLLHLDDVLEPYDDLPYSLYLEFRGMWPDFHRVLEPLGEREAKVVLRPMLSRLPQTRTRYNLPAELSKAGCEVSFVPWRDSRIEYLRVRERLAELVRAGLSREDALKSLTLHPAGAIGLGERLGSLEKDKEADLVFLDGDPLDPHTVVQRVMILGQIVWTADEKK